MVWPVVGALSNYSQGRKKRMTINRNLILLFAICIFVGGGIGSYKSFQLYRNQTIENNILKNEESSRWMAQSLEQKIKQMEAAVSYLDQSTIETLKRFGTRYFAYAFKDKKNEWSIKWKKLGEMGKEEILSEVDKFKFDEFSTEKRNWKMLDSEKIVFVTPVELAESHQLKTGFLVFGLNKGFFKFLTQARDKSSVVTPDLQKIVGSISDQELAEREDLREGTQGNSNQILERGESLEIETAYFSKETQTWILKSAEVPALSFIGSTFFTYFILSSIISLLIFVLAVSSRVVERQSMKHSLKSMSLFNFSNWKKRDVQESAFYEEEPLDEKVHINDFGEFIESVIDEETPRLKKLNIRVKTQMEERAKVYCAPRHISDLLKRLIGNSVLVLEDEGEKEIQIQLVERQKSYQLIYVDTRTSHMPSRRPTSLLAQTEGSMEGIDGIIAYAQWFYGKRLTVAKKGFCLSVDLLKEEAPSSLAKQGLIPKVDNSQAVITTQSQVDELNIEPFVPTLDRIEIVEDETDHELFFETGFEDRSKKGTEVVEEGSSLDELTPIELSHQKVEEDEEPAVSFDQVIEEFRLKELSFKEDDETRAKEVEAMSVADNDEESVTQDENGLYEIKSGQFKLKIRAPKKKDTDVHS